MPKLSIPQSWLAASVFAAIFTGCGGDVQAPESAPAVRAVGDMVVGVSEARAVLTGGGGVVVTGGDRANGGVRDVQRFDSAGMSFHAMDPLSVRRFVHSATLTARGTILVAGGFNTEGRFLDSVEEIDLASGHVSSRRPLCAPRDNQHAVALADGRVVFIGGDSDEGGYIRWIEIYDPAGPVDCALKLAVGRVHGQVVDAGGGVLYVLGGLSIGPDDEVVYLSSVERVDTVMRTVTPAGSLRVARKQFEASLLNDGRILVTGGFSDGAPVRDAEVYDPAAHASVAVGSMSQARAGHSATRLPDGRVLVAGGVGPDGVQRSTELYDPASGAFTSGPLLAQRRALHAALWIPSLHGVLLAGGYQGHGSYTATAELFVPE